jgi:hypothetical protein
MFCFLQKPAESWVQNVTHAYLGNNTIGISKKVQVLHQYVTSGKDARNWTYVLL